MHARMGAAAVRLAAHTEAALCGWDPITPLNPHLGDGHRVLVAKHHGAVD